MLRVTFEVVPFGIESRKRTIGVQEIGLLEETDGVGKYISKMEHDGKTPPENDIVFLQHNRALGPWPLVKRALEEHYEVPHGTSLPSGKVQS